MAATVLSIYKTAAKKDGEIVTIGQTVLLPSILIKVIPTAIGVLPGSWYLDDILIENFAMIAAITTRLSNPRCAFICIYYYTHTFCLNFFILIRSDQQLSVNDAFKLFVEGDFSHVPSSSSFDPEYIKNSTLKIFGRPANKVRILVCMYLTSLTKLIPIHRKISQSISR